MNFVKLKSTLDISDYLVQDTFISFGLTVDDMFKGIKYSSVKTSLRETVLDLIPEEYRRYFDISIMQVNTTIPPHTDSNITATINFYIKTDDCLTQFYSLKNETPAKHQITNQTTGYLFSIDELDKADSFVASPGEIWLLDVTKPHAVLPTNSNPIDRIALCLQSRKFNFEETIKLLEATDNL